MQQVGSAFRVRGKDRKTDELAVFECRCGRREIYPLWAVRSGRRQSCGCGRYATQGLRYKIDVALMRLRDAAGIPVQQSWTVADDAMAIDALLTDVGRAPDGQVLSLVDPATGWIDGNVRWNWPEVAMKQQQTMAMQRMAASGSKSDALWLVESQRIQRAMAKRINDHPVFEGDIPCCPLCQGKNLKPLFRRTHFRQYRCNECAKTFRIRRPIG